MMRKSYDKYIGEKFGKLTIIEFRQGDYTAKKRVRVKAKCKCDCGIEKWIDWDHRL